MVNRMARIITGPTFKTG